MPKKKTTKHAMQMTDEEALKHIFHPKIVKAVKKHLKNEGGNDKSQSQRKA